MTTYDEPGLERIWAQVAVDPRAALERTLSPTDLQTRSVPGSPWLYTDAASITRGVLTTVLPDGDTQEQHPWEWLAQLVRAHGVEVTAADLRSLPYTVELGPRVSRRLQETAHLREAYDG